MSMMSQFILKIGPLYWMAKEHIMQYLKDTLYFKLCFTHTNVTLRGFCNIDWIRDANKYQSTMEYVFFVGVGIISYNHKRQSRIALSTIKVEYIATILCTKDVI